VFSVDSAWNEFSVLGCSVSNTFDSGCSSIIEVLAVYSKSTYVTAASSVYCYSLTLAVFFLSFFCFFEENFFSITSAAFLTYLAVRLVYSAVFFTFSVTI
jgi:hypothetical protein